MVATGNNPVKTSAMVKFFKACFGLLFLVVAVIIGSVFVFSFGRWMWHLSTLLMGSLGQ